MSYYTAKKSILSVSWQVQVMECRYMNNNTLKKIKDFVLNKFLEANYSISPWKDRNYDPWSTWFWVEENDKILSAMRIVEKVPENCIPLEIAVIYGTKNPVLRYAVLEKNVADWNAVAFERTRTGWYAAKKTFRTVAKHCVEKGYEVVYGMYNPKLKGIEKLYLSEGAVFSKRYSNMVYFPGFNLNGDLSTFRVIELKNVSLQNIASKL